MKDHKRILLLCQHFYPEMISTGIHMTELATALTAQGWNVTVYAAQPALILEAENPKVPAEIVYKGITIKRAPSSGSHGGRLINRILFASTYVFLTAMSVFCTCRDFDLLLFTTNPPFLGVIGRLARACFGIPYVLIVYDIFPDAVVKLQVLREGSLAVRLWERVTRFIMNGADGVVVIGRDMADLVRRKVVRRNHHRIRLIQNWSDEHTVFPIPAERNSFRSRFNPAGHFLVQYSGRMAKGHNLEPIIEAAGILGDREILFQFIGDGAKKQLLMGMMSRKGLKNVQFLPYQPMSELAEVLSAADLAIVCLEAAMTGVSVPSKTYGVMASGTPILGLVDPASEIGLTIRESDCGIVISKPTGRELAQSIESLMEDRQRLKEMGQNAYSAFKKHYTLEAAARKYDQVFKACIS